jgi:GPH family glycoside/pentoside/hexuronide:cation symporter
VGLFFAAQFTTLTVWDAANRGSVFDKLRRLATSTSAWRVAVQGAPDILLGAQVYCVALGALMIVAGVAVFALVRERYYDRLAQSQEKVSITDTLYKALRCRPFRLQLLIVLAYNTGMSMVGTLGYYDTVYYVCKGDVASGAHWNFYMGIAGMVLGLVGIQVYAAVARRLGKIRALTCVQYAAIGVFVSTWWLYDPRYPWLQPFASGFIAFNNAGFWTLDGSIAADVMDYDELESGKRREGAFSACKSWVMKVGIAIGFLMAGEILARIGFDAKLGAHQQEHALTMIRVLLAVIPICGFVLALAALSRFPLTAQTMADIRRQLEERRGKV